MQRGHELGSEVSHESVAAVSNESNRPVARGGSGGSNEPPLRGKRSNYVEVR